MVIKIDPNKPYNNLPLLPPHGINLDGTQLLKATISASRSLSELNGIVKSIPNQDILLNAITLQEARFSSEIENIVTTNDSLYQADENFDKIKDPQTKEVFRYRQAVMCGCQKILERPLSTNLFIEIVSIIRNIALDIRSTPGTKISKNNSETIYTPPEGKEILRDKLSNLEEFIHAEDNIDPLIKMAIIHYQFEAIHPFTDGNGRTGRIINILYLIDKKLLDKPILFLSKYILQHKTEYYRLLQKVTEKND